MPDKPKSKSGQKKFEGGGYSAIGAVFARDAAIAPKPAAAQPVSAPVEKTTGVEPVPVERVSVTPEPVVELEPKPKLQAVLERPKTRIPASSKKAPKSRSKDSVGEESELVLSSNQVRGAKLRRPRLKAIRVECLDDEFADVEQLVFNLGRVAGHKLSNNILGRALFRLALDAEAEIRKAVEKNPPRPRPANGDSADLARHEDEWQQVIAEAMRSLQVRR